MNENSLHRTFILEENAFIIFHGDSFKQLRTRSKCRTNRSGHEGYSLRNHPSYCSSFQEPKVSVTTSEKIVAKVACM